MTKLHFEDKGTFIIAVRETKGSPVLYWNGKEFTESGRNFREYVTIGAAKGVLTRYQKKHGWFHSTLVTCRYEIEDGQIVHSPLAF